MRISDWSSDVCSSDLNTLQSFVACPIDHGIKQAVLVAEQIVHRRERAARSLDDRIDADALVSLFEAQRFGRVQDGLPPVFSSCRVSSVVHCGPHRSEEHTSELQSLMRISYAVCRFNKQQTKT